MTDQDDCVLCFLVHPIDCTCIVKSREPPKTPSVKRNVEPKLHSQEMHASGTCCRNRVELRAMVLFQASPSAYLLKNVACVLSEFHLLLNGDVKVGFLKRS